MFAFLKQVPKLNNMEDSLNTDLLKLQEELNTLDSAVKEITRSGQIAATVVVAVKDLQVRYASLLVDFTKLQTDALAENHQNAQTLFAAIANSHQQQVAKVDVLLQKYVDLAEASSRLPAEIAKIDFPTRFQQLETTTSSINVAMLNTQKLIASLDKSFQSDTEKTEELNKRIRRQNKRLGWLVFCGLLTMIFSAGVLALFLLKEKGIVLFH